MRMKLGRQAAITLAVVQHRVLVVAHHQVDSVGAKPIQFGRGHQSQLPHGYHAGYCRCSAEIIESSLYVLIPFMDEFI